ncbi:hypothetical protein EH63_25935 [Escherichia coli]|nr:hypothetical protein EH63_25935 [Escherichia coli]
MRPMEDVLLDLYKATQKYGQVDQVSFFKDIAGERGVRWFADACCGGWFRRAAKTDQRIAGGKGRGRSRCKSNGR